MKGKKTALVAICFTLIAVWALYFFGPGKRAKFALISFGTHMMALEECADLLGASLDTFASQTSDEAARTFVRYFTVSTLEEYRSLFKSGTAPNITNDEFAQWAAGRSRFRLALLARYELRGDNVRYSLLRYDATQGLVTMPSTLLLRADGEKWMAVGPAENKELALLHRFFLRIRTNALAAINRNLVSRQAFPKELPLEHEFANEAISFQTRTIDAAHTLALADRLEVSSDETVRRQIAIIAIKAGPSYAKVEPVTSADRQANSALCAYLHGKGFSAEKIDEALLLIKQQRYLAVATMAQEHDHAASVRDYVTKIRELYGEDKIKSLKQSQ
ncbi:MAG: hypothetical protein ACOZE5_00155 [Verrucomicrobiota bacterium]